ncbi:MAG: aldehyde ferredoxin oxidoreductase N-terminal domain-containing protein [Dehalococcoidia bacterium]|nr:aldehyde ferredoxin oxidoreductase N-terminal domain-containing protein [Dehalococcoidia bacterium]
MPGPENDQLIRVDMTDQTVSVEPYPEKWQLLGGRALSARILLTECDAACDPLGPDNVLVMAPGLLGGSSAPTSGRISFGAKSPLTGGIKESNSGGNPAQQLMKLGYRAIVVTGQPSDPEGRWGLEVTASGAKLVPADEFRAMWNYAMCEQLADRHAKTSSFIAIGPAGELRLTGASIATTDADNRFPSRHAGRGGLGAVMGSKGLKYVAVTPGSARVRKAAAADDFRAFNRNISARYRNGPRMYQGGTSAFVGVANALNTFAHKNRTEGQSPDVENLSGARIMESFATRGGKMHACQTGCVVQCSNIVHDTDGNYKTSGLEFETLTLLGSNIAMDSWEHVAELDRLCDDVGLDTIETGAAIGVLMDAGRAEWGDVEEVKRIIRDEIAEGTELGRIVGNGAVSVGRAFEHARVPAVKGQSLPAWDPRPLKVIGVTYASSAMGADHTAGMSTDTTLQEEDFAQVSQELQITNSVVDSSGFCSFLSPTLDDVREAYGLLYGIDVSREEIADLGWQCLQDEWAFNEGAGFTVQDDDLPACLREEGIGPDHSMKFDVSLETIAEVKVRMAPSEGMFTGGVVV